ncbi:hypothetical protein K4L44_02960 [Halosquirtibacter laminarini]|uniref:Uncharacterized protein n=1 Tax=Halosquirtibacter laminarini TaxID=3374600 RepID=A0AC61NLH2_9BACT|nr:hypothetical protein K4L44_02960 [Prolixibacteraceae bacterium]
MDWKNWNLMRILRLVFAIYTIHYVVESKEWGWLLFAALLLWQVITNASCGCQGGSCSMPPDKKKDNNHKVDTHELD